MIYVGFVITIDEAIRLLKLDRSIKQNFYETRPIQRILEDKGSCLHFEYIDKGACILGVPIRMDEPYSPVSDTIIQILLAKKVFLEEMKKQEADMSSVYLTWIEEEERLVENPEPYVISL
jgi:hypothetical protein